MALGLAAITYLNTGSSGSPVYVQQSYIKDLKLPVDFDKAESSSRGTGGIKTNEPALADIPVSGTAVYNPNDAQCKLFISNAFNRVAAEYAFATGPIATAGTQYVRAYCSIFKVDQSQNLSENQMFDFELSPSSPSLNGVTFANPSWNTT